MGCFLERSSEPTNEVPGIDSERIEDGEDFKHVHPALSALTFGVPRLLLPELVGHVALGLSSLAPSFGDQLDENLIVTA